MRNVEGSRGIVQTQVDRISLCNQRYPYIAEFTPCRPRHYVFPTNQSCWNHSLDLYIWYYTAISTDSLFPIMHSPTWKLVVHMVIKWSLRNSRICNRVSKNDFTLGNSRRARLLTDSRDCEDKRIEGLRETMIRNSAPAAAQEFPPQRDHHASPEDVDFKV